jgi:DNA-binding transcriptional ArsR family regulator
MKRSPTGQPAFLFKTLSDTTRLRLLNLLSTGETCVCELTDAFHIVQPKVSRHLARLKRAGLVEARREGKWMYYRLPRHGGSAGPPCARWFAAVDGKRCANERRTAAATEGLLPHNPTKTGQTSIK